VALLQTTLTGQAFAVHAAGTTTATSMGSPFAGFMAFNTIQHGVTSGTQAVSSTIIAGAQQQYGAVRASIEAEARANATVLQKDRGMAAFKLSLGRTSA